MTDTVSFFNTVADVQQVENLVNSLNKLEKTVTNTGRGKSDGIKELENKLKSLGTVGVSAVQAAAASTGTALQQLEALQSRYAAVDAKFQTSSGKQQTALARQLNAMLMDIVKTKGLIIGEMSSLQSAIANNKTKGLLNMNPEALNRWVNSILPTRTMFEAATKSRSAELQVVANAAIMQVQSAMLKANIGGSYSNVGSKVLHQAKVVADAIIPSPEDVAKALSKKMDEIKVVGDAAKLILYSKLNEGWSSKRSSEVIQAAGIADLMLPGANSVAEVLARRTQELKAVGDAAKLTLQAKLAEGATSNLRSGKLNAASAEKLVDMVYPPKSLFIAELARREKELKAIGDASKLLMQTKTLGGNASNLNSGALIETTTQATKLGKAMQSLGMDMNTVHSSARGLASGFGALWLTWGQMVPLLAGAAISFGLKSIVTMGAQVQDTFTQIRVLAGATVTEVQSLNKQMHELGTSGPFGPLAIAEAMKTLSLAGLDANKVLMAMPEVKNFAMAGTLDLQKAADALTTIGVAFSIQAENYGYISDVMSKAAAESKSSVEGMASAFKTASVVNQQYGVSLEDVAIGLSLLANAGISGTAAGTALRNMYADLSERTPKVAKAMKELGVSARDASGLMREQGAIFKDLMNELAKRSPTDAKDYLRRIFSERGSKEAIAILEALKARSDETGKSIATTYDELAAKIGASAGFSARAAAEMSLTPLNQMKEVASALQSSLIETFDQLSPVVLDMSKKLQNLFKSDSFKTGIAELARSVATLTEFLFEHITTIGNAVLGYFALKALLTVVASGFVMVGSGATAAAGGVGMLGVALQGLTKGNPILLMLSGLVALVSAGWALYAVNSTKAKEANDTIADNSGSLLEQMQKELDRHNKLNDAKRLGISLTELEHRQKLTVALNTSSPAVIQAKKELDESKPLMGRLLDPESKFGYSPKEIAAQQKYALAVANEKEQKDQLLLVDRMLTVEREKQAEAVKKADADRRNAAKNGIPDAASVAKASGIYKNIQAEADNSLATVNKWVTESLRRVTDMATQEGVILKAQYDVREISQGTFLAREVQNVERAEAEKLAILNEGIQDYAKAYGARAAAIVAAAEEKRASTIKPRAGELEEQAKQLQGDLNVLANSAVTDMEKMTNAIDKVKGDAFARLSVQASKSKMELMKLRDEADKFWKDEIHNREKADKQAGLDESLRYANPGVTANIQAQAAQLEKYSDKVREMDKVYQDASQAVTDFVAAVDPANMTEGEWSKYKTLSENLAEIVAIRDQLAAGAPLAELLAMKAGEAAQLKIDRDTVGRLTTETAAAIELGLTKGGKEGAKALRAIVIAELTKPVRLVVEAFINPIMGAVSEAFGLTGQSGGSGLLSSLGSTATLYKTLSTGTAGNIGGGIGSLFGTTAGNSATAAMLTGDVASATAAAQAAAIAGGAATETAAAGASLGASMGGAMSSIMAAAPYIAAFVAAAYVLEKYVVSQATIHQGGGSQYSASGGLKTTSVIVPESVSEGYWAPNGDGDPVWVADRQVKAAYTRGLGAGDEGFNGGFTNVGYSQQAVDLTSGLAKGIVGLLDSTAKSFGETAGYTAATSFADDTSKDGAWGSLVISKAEKVLTDWTAGTGSGFRTFSDGEAGKTEYEAAIAASLRSVLKDIDLPSWAETMIDDIGDTPTLKALTEEVAKINIMAEAFVTMGEKMTGFADISDEAISVLIKASGGFEAMAANASTYYDNFYSETEKSSYVLTDIADRLAEFNVEMPTTREGFRALVEAQQKLGVEGMPVVATLFEVAGAFAAVVPAVEELAGALQMTPQEIADQRLSLEDQKGLLVGSITEREIEARAIHASNMALFDEITLLQQEKVIQEKVNDLKKTGSALEIELLLAQGKTAEAKAAQRALDTAGMSEAELVQYNYNETLRDQITVVNELKAAEEALATERSGLMDQLWSATNQTALIRQKQMGGIDPSNRPIQQSLYDIDDADKAFAALKTAVETEKTRLATKLADDKAALQAQLVTVSNDVSAETDLIKKAYDIKHAAYEAQIAAAEKAKDDIVGIASALSDAVKSAADISEELAFAAFQRARATVAAAASANNIRAPGLEDAVGVVRQDSEKFYGSFVDYARDQGRTNNDLKKLNDTAQSQLSQFDQTILALKAQDDVAKLLSEAEIAVAIEKGNEAAALATAQNEAINAQIAALDTQYALDIKKLDQTITDAEKQLNALHGINTSVLTVAQAVGSFNSAVSKAVTSVESVANAAYSQSAVNKVTISQLSKSVGTYVNTTAPLTGSSETAASLGIMGFAVGTNYVPYDMIAQIHKGEAIVPAAYNPAADGGGNNNQSNAELVAELRAMRLELAEIKMQALATTNNTKATAKQLERWDVDGLPETIVL